MIISGIGEWGDGTSLGGATLVVPRLADVQRWFQRPGELSRIVVAADPGVSPERLATAIRRELPGTVTVKTGAADAAEQADAANDAIGSFLTPALLALSGAALLVGAFIIFNTFSITVAQRAREFALLRSLGASAGPGADRGRRSRRLRSASPLRCSACSPASASPRSSARSSTPRSTCPRAGWCWPDARSRSRSASASA